MYNETRWIANSLDDHVSKALLGSLLIPAGLETYPGTFSNSLRTLLSVLAVERISLNLQNLLWQLDYNDSA